MSQTDDTIKWDRPPARDESRRQRLIGKHLAYGWGGLVLFILLGITLEALHAFKTPLYTDTENETRRLLWRLAHAHGALLSMLQLGASWTFSWLDSNNRPAPDRLISRSLGLALILIPGGFFFAGADAVDGDPGLGIILVPAGAIFLLAATVLLFAAARRRDEREDSESQ